MSEDLVLIHTYSDAGAAVAAQGELLAAGIHSILVSETPTGSTGSIATGVSLAVHRRDAELAATVLSLGASHGEDEAGSAGDSDRT